MSVVVLLVAIGVAMTPFAHSMTLTSIVKIDYGELRGFIREVNNTGGLKVRGYRGIPFAQAKRFENPEPPKAWEGVKNMVALGKACPQMLNPIGVQKIEDMSEDCLNLNVFVPDNITSSARLPVMVWIYGGGFNVGSNRMYDGSYIATLGKVVVVAINYRLNVFGFLTNGKGGGIKGNYGMFDQVEGLKWVKKNIEKFNGDPNKVTIFGESAGGASVSLLMLSKLTEGLFHRAIPQSGDATAFWATGTYESLGKQMRAFAKLAGCPDDLSKLKDCLKPKNFMEIINASLAVPFPSFIPVVDNNFLQDHPMVLYEKQDFEKRNVLTGVTNDEGTVFTNALGGASVYNVTKGVSRDTFLKYLRGGALAGVIPGSQPVLIDATIHQYTDYTDVSSPIRNRRMFQDLLGDVGFVMPCIRATNVLSKSKKAKIYLYSFDHRLESVFGMQLPSWVRANHGADVPLVFGYPLLNASTSIDANFTQDIITYWTNFAKSGDPNSPDSVGVTWPEYNLEQQKYMSLKPNMAVNSHLRADYMGYWNKFIPNALRAAPKPKPCPTCKPCTSAAEARKATAAAILLSALLTSWLL